MADVRSMLRAERESRRITHPHASYTSTGTLLCNLCDVSIKSDKAWSAHLHSTEHNVRSGRPKEAASTPAATSKKRKAVEFDEPITERKKVRGPASNEYPTPDQDEPQQAVLAAEDESIEPHTPKQDRQDELHTPQQDEEHRHDQPEQDEEEVNAADLEALERDLAEMEQQTITEDKQSALAALSAGPTISALALATGEELTKKDDDTAPRRNKRDIENEEDREDAARALEEEFAEMESLQERAKRLRDRREALRIASVQPQDPPATNEPDKPPLDEDDTDDDSGYDDWGFGGN